MMSDEEEAQIEDPFEEAFFDGIVCLIQHISDDFFEMYIDINYKSPINYQVQKNLPKPGQGYRNSI
jgi:hypothetical protein